MDTVIDAHQHYWDIGRDDYGWAAQGLASLDRNFLPDHLEPLLRESAVSKTVVVQVLNSDAETVWMAQLAERYPTIAGVVGWVNLRQSPESLKTDLDEVTASGRIVGIRHLVHEESDDDWLIRRDVLEGLAVLEDAGVPFDLLLRPHHLRHVPTLSDRLPKLRMVIDHIAKPRIRDHVTQPWAEALGAAAENPNVWCKLSGMVTEADHTSWVPEDLAPYVETALRVFGPGRLMYGSDWPVCTLAASYKQVHTALRSVLGGQDPASEHSIFARSATQFYGLAEPNQELSA
jgi:L-fuconolactonase